MSHAQTLVHEHSGPMSLMGATSIVDAFWQQVRSLDSRSALRFHDGPSWGSMSWRDYGEAVRRTAAGLLHLGIEPGDRVGIMSNNRWEWHVVDLATMSCGAVTVPIYQTSSSSQVAYTLSHSEARVCFVENTDQLAKVLLRRHELPMLEHVYVFNVADGLDDDFVGALVDVMELGDDLLLRTPDAVDDRRSTITSDTLATLVYTSGTTGPPKGTMLTHANVLANLEHITAVVPIDSNDRFLSFLPLSHIAERTVSDFGQIVSGGETWFAQSLSSVPDDIRACRPTIFFAVPRVWEKFRDAIHTGLLEQPHVVQSLAGRLFDESAGGHRPGMVADLGRRIEHLGLVETLGRRIRHQLGLDQCRYFVSGAAPIAPELLDWFSRIGITIAEVYGQTEGCAVTTLNPPTAIRLGTVGPPVPGVEVRIGDDQEVLVRGDNVTPGYFKAEQATNELLDADGWMHTGDLGRLDDDGYLSITGRKKDLIITSSGKNISPQEIELKLRNEPLISQAVVVGDNRPYLVALLTIDADELAEWATANGKLPDTQALRDDPQLLELVTENVERVNEELARIEQIKKWKILPHDLSMAENELTPTLKVKRQVVLERNADLIAQLYASAAA